MTVNHTDGIVIDTTKIRFVLGANGSISVVGDAGAITGAVSTTFVDLIDNRRSDVDVAPLRLVADCLLLGRSRPVEPVTM